MDIARVISKMLYCDDIVRGVEMTEGVIEKAPEMQEIIAWLRGETTIDAHYSTPLPAQRKIMLKIARELEGGQ